MHRDESCPLLRGLELAPRRSDQREWVSKPALLTGKAEAGMDHECEYVFLNRVRLIFLTSLFHNMWPLKFRRAPMAVGFPRQKRNLPDPGSALCARHLLRGLHTEYFLEDLWVISGGSFAGRVSFPLGGT